MSTTPTRKKVPLQILAAVLIAVVPPTLSYCQATAEMRAKNKKTNDQANAGYETLVESVKELQETVKKQHESILTLRASIGTLMQIVARHDVGTGMGGSGTGSAASGSGDDVALRMTAPPPPAPEPKFAPLPHDISAAAQQQMAK